MSWAYRGFLFAEWVVSRLPERISRPLARGCGTIYYYLFPGKRDLVKRNMRRALGPEADRGRVANTAKRACRYYAEYWLDILWLPTRSREYVLERFGAIGEDILLGVLAEGKGMIVVLPHFGSWEAGAVYLSSLGRFAAVAEVLKPPELFELFCKLRAGVGIEIFPYDHSTETRDSMVEALKNNYMLALLSDRDLKGTGVEVDFFGEKTTMPPGPAALALRSGAPIVCVNVRNLDGEWLGHATSPIYVDPGMDRDEALRSTMQQVASRLETLIREDPAQWHMFMPAWPSDRE